jgi:PKD repeat protein
MMFACDQIAIAAVVLGLLCTTSDGQSPSAIILVNGRSGSIVGMGDFIVATEQNVTIECQLMGGTPISYQWIISGPMTISFQNAERQFHQVFNLTELYSIHVQVTDNLNRTAIATATIWAEETIRGLRILPDKGHIMLNEMQIFEASVESGSHISLNWTITYEPSGQADQYFTATQNYTFSKEGTYLVQLVASNNVSTQTKIQTVIVQRPLSGLHAVFNEKRVSGNTALTVAAGNVIELKANSSGSAPNYQWNLLYDFNMVFTINPCSSIYKVNWRVLGRNPDLSVIFNSLGPHRIILCASNFAMSSPVYENIILEVLEPIGTGSLTVSPSTTILHNSSASFTVQLAGGSSAVYNWTVINPTGSIVENVLSNSSFDFFFTEDGVHTVRVIATNDISSSDLMQSIIYVQPRLCLPPLLTAITLPLVQEQLRSRTFRLEVSATPTCTSFTIRYQWIVYPKQKGLDCSVKAAKTQHVEMLDITTVNPIITIPQRLFPLGTYCFRFEASLGSALSTVTYTVSIRESDLVATIKGGDTRLVGALQSLELDGSGSYDPDNGLGAIPGVASNLSYLWFCRSAPGIPTGGRCKTRTDKDLFEKGFDCFGDGQMTSAVVTIPGNTLQANRTYLFELQVAEGNRNSTTYHQVI